MSQYFIVNLNNRDFSFSKCVPMCKDCGYGDCIAPPNNCECYINYRKVQFGGCQPICKKSCQNGMCIAPDTCRCNKGFTLSKNKFICDPTCDEKCENSTCTAPNTCTCHDGYTQDTQFRYFILFLDKTLLVKMFVFQFIK